MFSYPDPRATDPRQHRLQRILEMIPGILTWFTLIGMFVFSFWLPVWVAVFIIAFDIYWLFRTIYIAIYSIAAFRKMQLHKGIDWMNACLKTENIEKFLSDVSNECKEAKKEYLNKYWRFFSREKRKIKKKLRILKELKKEIREVSRRDMLKFMKWKDVYHVVLLPTANEGAEIIEPAIQALADSEYPNEKFIILLATEEREDKEKRERKADYLKNKFGKTFFDFLVTVHKVAPGEMKMKSSNATYAAKELKKYLEEKNIPLENVILSNFDCDTCAHPRYFAALTWKYITEPKRLRFAYQPLPMYHNNIWDTNAFVRIIVTGSSFWHMVEAMRPEHMVTFSSHSEAFKTIVDVGYWPVNIISEDSLIFWKCYTHFDGDYEVKPIYLPVSLDAVLANSYWKTIVNQYKQKRRWAYGIENFPLLARAFLANKKIPFGKKARYLLVMLEGHWSWATNAFIIALLGWLPVIIGGPAFNQSVLAHNLPYITRYLMNAALIGLVISMFLSLMLLPPRPAKYSRKRYIYMFLQWFLVPVTAPFLGAMPAVDSQTRILFGKYFGEFWVTEKVRKEHSVEVSPRQQ
ncbi:MAG: glycosyltransferase family 2 protein [Patescibacteria group bacterium]|nr:glycosyltransferase family 2 protein [Patescibacteria group bacterium]